MNLSYVVIPLITIAVAVLGGLITLSGMYWYRSLKLPSFTPSGWIISLVWNVIFTLSAISAVIVWNSKDAGVIIGFFVANAVLNVLWCAVFFGAQDILSGIFVAVFLEFSVLALIVLIWPVSILASFLLLPYAVWVGFAVFLNHQIWILNK